jgi:hypothetical protein
VKIRAEHAEPSREDLELATGSVLLFAQRVADDTIADARREADRILEQALAALPAPPTQPAPPAPVERDVPEIDAPAVAELRERAEALQIESRLRNLLMNDLIECVAELSMRVEREIGEAMQQLEHARERALADFSAIDALARLAGMPPDAHPGQLAPAPVEVPAATHAPAPPMAAPTVEVVDEPLEPVTDSFVIDLRDALNNDRNADPHDDFDELFATRGVYMESRESRRSRWIRSAGLFSTVLGTKGAEA